MPEVSAWTKTATNSSDGNTDQPRVHAALWVGDRTLFMRNGVTCAACRLQQSVTGQKGAERLHVRFTTTEMVVTEIDDLHHPGRSIRCELMMRFPGGLMFHITALQNSQGGQEETIAGMAFVLRRNRKWHLKMFGHVDGVDAAHDCLFDAVEEV